MSTGRGSTAAAAASMHNDDDDDDDNGTSGGFNMTLPGFRHTWEDENRMQRFSVVLHVPGGTSAENFSVRFNQNATEMVVSYHMAAAAVDLNNLLLEEFVDGSGRPIYTSNMSRAIELSKVVDESTVVFSFQEMSRIQAIGGGPTFDMVIPLPFRCTGTLAGYMGQGGMRVSDKIINIGGALRVVTYLYIDLLAADEKEKTKAIDKTLTIDQIVALRKRKADGSKKPAADPKKTKTDSNNNSGNNANNGNNSDSTTGGCANAPQEHRSFLE